MKVTQESKIVLQYMVYNLSSVNKGQSLCQRNQVEWMSIGKVN